MKAKRSDPKLTRLSEQNVKLQAQIEASLRRLLQSATRLQKLRRQQSRNRKALAKRQAEFMAEQEQRREARKRVDGGTTDNGQPYPPAELIV